MRPCRRPPEPFAYPKIDCITNNPITTADALRISLTSRTS